MAKRPYPSDKADQYMLRFPDGMRDQLKKAAANAGRSLNAEIIQRLEATLQSERNLEETKDILGRARSMMQETQDEWEKRMDQIEKMRIEFSDGYEQRLERLLSETEKIKALRSRYEDAIKSVLGQEDP